MKNKRSAEIASILLVCWSNR